MLANITISDLAVVDRLDLDLESGMSVLTGETGAGKSILLTALGLALGDRADSGIIRPNCERAEINIEFDLKDAPTAQSWLKENDLDDEELCLIRRVISQDGRSRAYINNRPVTLQTLQSLSRLLVEIHGQHAHLTLLNGEEQRRLLDGFSNNRPLLDELAEIYSAWKQTRHELDTLVRAADNRQEREELLTFQLDELRQLDLDNFDYPALAEEHRTQANLDEILTQGGQQMDILYDGEEQSVNRMLNHSIQALSGLGEYAAGLGAIADQLSEAQIQIDEACHELRRYLDSQEADPQRLAWLEEQIGMVHDLTRKHRCEPEELPETAHKLERELNALTHGSECIDQLRDQCERLLGRYRDLAGNLSRQRREAGLELSARITAMIRELGMPHGEFIANVNPEENGKPTPYGNDVIEFLVSANPGLPPKALAKVASGGELSRISLAIQVTTSTDKTTPTMIFDEVDAGIGGGIAEIVGQKMRALGGDRQVMCVTHLPQVAAQAHHHLFVAKNNRKNTTSSTVRKLNEEERLTELARMLGGVNITEKTLAHAKEMLHAGDSNP